jgi:uncharacterized protein involved in outer membrane biogenesis
MSQAVKIVGGVIAVVIIVAAAVLLYAARNLNSIIEERQGYLLAKVSDALDRKVEVSEIKVTLGWGMMADLTGLKIEDDPAISDRPFVEAADAYAKVDLLPLLSRHIHVTEVRLKNPEVHIIRTEQGGYNVSTIGKKRPDNAETPESLNPKGSSLKGAPIASGHGNLVATSKRAGNQNLSAFYVNSLIIDKGVIVYEERGPKHQTVNIQDVDLSITDFSLTRVFDLSLTLAVLSDKQNVDISGSFGPLAQNGALDVKDAVLKIKAKLGPVEIARLRAIGVVGQAIPEALSVPDPVSLEATADGTTSQIKFHLNSDLSGDRVAWADAFDKPASVPLKLSADGSRSDAGLEIVQANFTLGDLDANARKIHFGNGKVSARIDTNRFDIGAMAKILPVLQKYNASGHAEIHTDINVANKQPQANGTVTLADVSLSRPSDKNSSVDNLNGDIRLVDRGLDAGPLKFDFGGGHATATIHANSIQPLNASYNLSIDTIKVANFAPDRPADEQLSNVTVTGTMAQGGELSVNAKVTASHGNLANIVFKGLDLSATMIGNQLEVQSVKLGAFNGDIAASGKATLGDHREFALNLVANNVDIQSALDSQQAKSAGMIRGILNAQLQVSGRGAKFDAIKPTLAGNGRATVHDGKLIGVNLAKDALNKTNGIPEIGDLVPAPIVQKHPELFDSPDTDINSASLTFALTGSRITTHDLVVQTPDYWMTGDGWFDMEKNIEMAAHLLLTSEFTKEVIAEKKNVVYLTNKDGQVDIPFGVRGALPKPLVLPDVAQLAQLAGSHLIQDKGQKALNKFLNKKVKGLNIPFVNGGGSSSGSNANPSDNPIDQLKGLLH